MAIKALKIAVISDLHCHSPRKHADGIIETYLLTDLLRVPLNDHPVESLIRIIRDSSKQAEPIIADITLCPGDFTDKADVQGFISGWGFSLELNDELGSKEIIATLGNHDVDVYNNHSNYTLDIAKGIKRGFPLHCDLDCDTFWSKGCVFIERETFRILVINSCHFHHHQDMAKSGKVGDDMLDYINVYLSAKMDDKIMIAMSHHHPIDHSVLKLGEKDKLVNGDELLNILGKFKFDLFVHGHKHDPLLRIHNTTEGNFKLPIFSAGSFSSSSNLMFTSRRNCFHLIDIIKDKSTKGEIKTWTFLPKIGWRINLDESGFAPYTGFGSDKTVDQIFLAIKEVMKDRKIENWDTVAEKVPDIKHLIPADAKQLSDLLKYNNYNIDDHIWLKPKKIYNLEMISNES